MKLSKKHRRYAAFALLAFVALLVLRWFGSMFAGGSSSTGKGGTTKGSEAAASAAALEEAESGLLAEAGEAWADVKAAAEGAYDELEAAYDRWVNGADEKGIEGTGDLRESKP